MAGPATAPTRLRPAGVAIRLAVVILLLLVGDRLTRDIELPFLIGFPALIAYLAVILICGIHIADFLSDQYDRVRASRRD